MYFTIRIFAGVIDLLIGYFLPLALILSVADLPFKHIDLYAQLCFVVYGILLSLVFNGQTFGKMAGRIHVDYTDGQQQSVLHVGLREAAKLLYFLPVIGLPLLLISILSLSITKKKTLHDWIGQTVVQPTYTIHERSE